MKCTEYSGLESGELAWIHDTKSGDVSSALTYVSGDKSILKEMYQKKGGEVREGESLTNLRYGIGFGNGVDRMTRLTFTAWLEKYFDECIKHKCVVLDVQGLDLLQGSPFLKNFKSDDLEEGEPEQGVTITLQKMGVFDWKPDGIVLSKLETGPSPEADEDIDARQGQLFNVAVQGATIAKTWCQQKKVFCQPMDKVFILVVGDVEYERAVSDELLEGLGKNPNPWDASISGFDACGKPSEGRRKFGTSMSNTVNYIEYAVLGNVRLMRSTSAQMIATSSFKITDPASRMGLACVQGLASFVLGGWCVGTVMDSTASRGVHGPAMTPANHKAAISVNVNIEWWSANKLHEHYGPKDVDGRKDAEETEGAEEPEEEEGGEGY
jgi:hypothetical protein